MNFTIMISSTGARDMNRKRKFLIKETVCLGQKKFSTAVITLLKVVITSDITGVFFQDYLHLGDRILQKDCNRLPCIEPRKLRLRDAGVDIFSSGFLRNIS